MWLRAQPTRPTKVVLRTFIRHTAYSSKTEEPTLNEEPKPNTNSNPNPNSNPYPNPNPKPTKKTKMSFQPLKGMVNRGNETLKDVYTKKPPESQPLEIAHKEFLSLVKDHRSKDGGNVRLDIKGHLAVLEFSNVTSRNSITGYMMSQLAWQVDYLLSNQMPEVTGLLLMGEAEGKAFCSGADLGLVRDIVNTSERGVLMSNFMTDALNRIRSSGLISVCFLNGPAIGGGAEIATVGDYRLMPDRDSSAFVSFIHPKLGASPGWGGARRLYSIVGRKKAIEMACTGEPLLPGRALESGFVDKILNIGTNRADVLQETELFLNVFLKQKYPASVQAIKRTIANIENLDVFDSKKYEADAFKDRWFSRDNASVFEGK